MNFLFSKFSKLKPVWKSLSKRRKLQCLILLIFSLVSAAFELANLGALLPFMQLLVNPKDGLSLLGPLEGLLKQLPEQYLLLSLGFSFIIMVISSTVLRAVTLRTQLRLGGLIESDLRVTLFSKFISQSLDWHLQQNSSALLAYITKDVQQVSSTVRSILSLLVNLTIVLILGSSLIVINPPVMLTTCAVLAGVYGFTFLVTRSSLRLDGQRLRNNNQQSLKIFQEGIGSIRDVLLDRSQSFFLDSFESCSKSAKIAGAKYYL